MRQDNQYAAIAPDTVSVSGAKLWNSIPINIRNSNAIVTFKIHMYQHLLEHQNHMGTNPNLSNKKLDLHQFLHNVKEFDLFEKYVN